MRLLLYNIRYGTGGKVRRLPISGYLGRTHRNLADLIGFIKPLDPDIVGLIEVDAGSYRSRQCNQAGQIAEALGHYHCYRSKYTSRVAGRIPIMNKQGNAFITRDTIQNETFHYFDHGLKRLVIELELENVVVYLVHLALKFRQRHHQLGELYDLVKGTAKPYIVAGDFNALWGPKEMDLFQAATGLTNANSAGYPTFPSWAPKRQLDFVLYSEGIQPRGLQVPAVTFSDHLPMVFDFEI
ncbi:MAG: endonuclease [Verrucomicrobia bacterium]|jgi:endonuclease/exonuclease/phosphatase family metal-dependent hydrolase|nr:endonuclease [Verrucomicrobiota bacterium]MBT7067500.1 endonuclease [Verrucomicrobiota bacterium]MBT7700986.1 endonuclease [Verrucomicrobiota bacterium]